LRSRTQPLAIVSEQLKAYAQRGVFRSFSQTQGQGSHAEFRFYWLWDLPLCLRFDGKRKTLSFKNLLPGVAPRSELHARLKDFIHARYADYLPEHRRLDRKRVLVRCSNRQGRLSVTFLIVKQDYDYAVKKALNLVSEMFVGFLNVQFPEYMAQHFRRPED
jgi:hypothetical protein